MAVLAGVVAVAGLAVVGCGRVAFEPNAPDDGAIGIALPACENVEQDPGEDGIDCGGSCPLACVGARCTASGSCVTGSCIAGVCELAAGPPSWLPGPSIPIPRTWTQAATDGAGTIHVVGGALATGAVPGDVADTLALPAGATSWQSEPQLNEPRYAHAVGALDGVVYAYGGRSGGTDAARLTIEALVDGAWTFKQPYGGNAGIAMIGGPDGRLYVEDFNLHAYTLATDSWMVRAQVTASRDSVAGALGRDGRVYEITGLAESNNARLANCDAYDVVTNVWSPCAPAGLARGHAAAASAPDGRIYVIGGDIGSGSTDDVEAYDVDRDQWLAMPPLVNSRARHAVAVGGNGRIYAIGGQASGTVLGSVDVYGPIVVAPTAPVRVGSLVTLGASNFAATAIVVARIDGVAIATTTTDANGVGVMTFTMPPLGSGAHEIVAIDQRSQYPVRTRIDVQ